MYMTDLYVDPGENAPAKGSKTAGASAKKKKVEFNWDVRMKYINKITGVQTKSIELAIHAKKPTFSTSVCRIVLAKLWSEKWMDKRNDENDGTCKFNDKHYGTCNRNEKHYGTCNHNGKHYGLKERIEGRSGVFVRPDQPKEKVQK